MSEPRDEKGLQSRIWAAVIKRWPNAWVFHPIGGPFQLPGVPDLLMCVNGRFVGAEVKHQKAGESWAHAVKRATPQQRLQIKLINAAGGAAAVVTSVEDAIALVERALAA